MKDLLSLSSELAFELLPAPSFFAQLFLALTESITFSPLEGSAAIAAISVARPTPRSGRRRRGCSTFLVSRGGFSPLGPAGFFASSRIVPIALLFPQAATASISLLLSIGVATFVFFVGLSAFGFLAVARGRGRRCSNRLPLGLVVVNRYLYAAAVSFGRAL